MRPGKPVRPASDEDGVPAGDLPPGFVPVASTARPRRGLATALQVTIGTGQRCPRCHGALDDQDDLAACAACLTVAHAECVAEGGACTTLGCAGPAPASRRRGARSSSSGSDAPRPRRRWLPVGAALLGVAGVVTGGIVGLRPPPPPPGLAIVAVEVEPVPLTQPSGYGGSPLFGGAGEPTVLVRGRLDVRGADGAPVEVLVNGQRAAVGGGVRAVCGTGLSSWSRWSAPRDTGERWFELVVADASTVEVVARLRDLEARQRIARPAVVPQVIVPPVVRPVQPVIYYPLDAGPTLGDVSVPPIVDGPMVPVRGWIGACPAGSTLSVRGPEGDVTLPATPGAFDLVVTLPSAGAHEITVTVTDPHGRRAFTTRAVVRRPETPRCVKSEHDCDGSCFPVERTNLSAPPIERHCLPPGDEQLRPR